MKRLVPEFTAFLREKINARTTVFTPSPNENGEYLRAMAGYSFIVVHDWDQEFANIITSGDFEAELATQWMSYVRERSRCIGSRA